MSELLISVLVNRHELSTFRENSKVRRWRQCVANALNERDVSGNHCRGSSYHSSRKSKFLAKPKLNSSFWRAGKYMIVEKNSSIKIRFCISSPLRGAEI